MRNASKCGFSKFQHKNFSYSRGKSETALGENRKDRVCLLLLFHEWQNPELLRGYLYFQNALLILMIFRNKYSRAVMVGMYAHGPDMLVVPIWRARCSKSFWHHTRGPIKHWTRVTCWLQYKSVNLRLRTPQPQLFIWVKHHMPGKNWKQPETTALVNTFSFCNVHRPSS